MAMVGNDLGDAIRAAIDGVADKSDRTAVFRAMGGAIVTYVATNADVETEIAVSACAAGGVVAGVNGTATGGVS